MLLVRNTWVPCPTTISAPPNPEWKESGRFLCLSWLVRRSTFQWNIYYRGACSWPPWRSSIVDSQKLRCCHLVRSLSPSRPAKQFPCHQDHLLDTEHKFKVDPSASVAAAIPLTYGSVTSHVQTDQRRTHHGRCRAHVNCTL